jgi:TPR repeat protein
MRTRIALMILLVAAGWAFFWFVVEHRSVGSARSAFESGDSAGIAILAKRGDPEAEYYMGVMREEGQAVSKDYAAAAAWFRKAAAQGHLLAQRRLGFCYAEGRGVPRDDGQAAFWLEKAALRGDLPSQVRLGRLYAEKEAWGAAARWYRAAADRGDGEAQYGFAWLCHEGRGGARDDVLATMYMILSAAHGYQPAIRFRMGGGEDFGLTTEQAARAMQMAQSWKPANADANP